MKIANKIIYNILGPKRTGKDTDGDRTNDEDDCQPGNPMRQDVISQMGPTRLRQMGIKSEPQVQGEQVKAKVRVLTKDIKSKIY